MPCLGQHLEHPAGHLQPALQRLVGVRVRAERNRPADVARPRQLLLQQPGGILLDEYLGLEVEPGRQAQMAVARAGVAIDAAVLAAAIGVDRLVERYVRQVVVRDDRACPVGEQLRRRSRLVGQRLEAAPAVVERLALEALEPALGIERGTAALVHTRQHRDPSVWEHSRNKYQCCGPPSSSPRRASPDSRATSAVV